MLANAGIVPVMFCTKWFCCMFVDVMPMETVTRIWDSYVFLSVFLFLF